MPPFPESPRCLSPFQGNLFSLHCLDFQAEDRLTPRWHVGQPCGKASWESLVGNVGQKTCNTTLKTWIPKQESIDKLLSATEHDKESNDTFPLKVAYQTTEGEQTFEDAIKNENPHLYDKINNSLPKAEKALNLLYIEEFETSLNTPRYIESGLIWLDNILQNKLFNDEEAKNE